MTASAVRVYSSITLKNRICRPQEVTSDWKSKLTTGIGYWARNRFCSPAPGPVRCFFLALGLQVSPSRRQSRRIRVVFNAAPVPAWLRQQVPAGFPPPPLRMFHRDRPQIRAQLGFLEASLRGPCAARTGSVPAPCTRTFQTPRTSPAPSELHGVGVRGSEFSLRHLDHRMSFIEHPLALPDLGDDLLRGMSACHDS